jgi:hypothetical protein
MKWPSAPIATPTVAGPHSEVEQLAAEWISVGVREKLLGEKMRVVDARASEVRSGVVRADETGMAVWHASPL